MSVRWRRWSFLLAAIVLAGGLVAGVPSTRHGVLRSIGRVLVVDDPVEPADVIVVPKWAGAAGAIDAADLVRSGIAGRVAVLPEAAKPSEQELTRRGVSFANENADLAQLLRALGVKNVELIPEPADGTEGEGRVLLAWCARRQFRSILIVSSPDHSRRVSRVLHRSMGGHPATVKIRAARFSSFDPERWWRTREGVRTGIVELQKLALDVLRHPLS